MSQQMMLMKRRSSLQKMSFDDEASHDHHPCYSDSVSEGASGYSYSESYRGFNEPRQLPFRVKCPIMSRILSTAMSVIDRTSPKASNRYATQTYGEVTCYESEQSMEVNGSSFFKYLEKNFSTPKVRQEYALNWPVTKYSDTEDDDELFSKVSEKKNGLGLMQFHTRTYSQVIQAIEDELLSESCDSKYDEMSLMFSDSDDKASDSLDSCYMMELAQSASLASGWPLCKIPVVKTPQHCSKSRSQSVELQLVPVSEQLGWRLFGLDELKCATASFSQDNMIGRGGCSKVYKGCLTDGKVVAVKVLKQNKDASKDLYSEIDIMSSLSHKHITAFLGACFEYDQHIFVYEYMSEGSLDEHLHGPGMKPELNWELRFKVAVVIAEALNYLHHECPRPIIHRDVKSSNILLSGDFQPQLSDFGLAIWGPSDKRQQHGADTDLVGTFGYIAPEYFMHGKVSDKVDVYAFGVLLLELISGRKPILDTEGVPGQQSLVKWAKPMMDSGDIRALADPNLSGRFDAIQMQTLVSAAALCTTQSARARPTMTQVLKLLKGETSGKELLAVTQAHHSGTWSEDDEFWIASELDRPCLSLALMDTDDDESTPTPIISVKKIKRRNTIADYLERSP